VSLRCTEFYPNAVGLQCRRFVTLEVVTFLGFVGMMMMMMMMMMIQVQALYSVGDVDNDES